VGPERPRVGDPLLTTYLLDTTVLIAHLRGDGDVVAMILRLLREGHVLGTTCVNVAEVERGLLPKEPPVAGALLARLRFLDTGREAATRAGRYQREFARRGRTIHMADALIAGTARAHGAVVLTDNRRDFPMRDVVIQTPPSA
jgi:predicted nucleic acid-binding protein